MSASTHDRIQPDSLARRWMLALLLTGVTVLSARFAEWIPPTPIPLTCQVFAVLLSGLLLGSRWGAVAQAQYLLLGGVHLPVFAHGGSGFTSLFGLTGGYLWSYPIAAFVVGWIVEQGVSEDLRARIHREFLACALGLWIIYTSGCIWFGVLSHLSPLAVLFQGALIFLAWDTVKALGAIAVANGIRWNRGQRRV